MKRVISAIVCSLLLLFSVGAMAQSNGDKLFLEGQQMQKVMSVSSQKGAIKKFQAAKIVYTAAEKKKMCDNQIVICRENIKRLSAGKTKAKRPVTEKKEVEEKKNEVKEEIVETRGDVRLSLSSNVLDFKAKPKTGQQSVDVKCNYNDWKVTDHPDWVTVYRAENKISVEVTENTTYTKRSGIITIVCGKKEVNLIVNQEKKKKGLGFLDDLNINL